MSERGLHVTNIEQERVTEPDGRGGFVDHYHVHFTTPSGTRTHVKVPLDRYTPRNVAATIQAETAAVEGVHALEDTPLDQMPPAAG